ncbi:mechanosensitive ion channel family protein [Alkalibacterium kapii]|uniref:Mechanosensitive ion channel protein MscS n=1 Tax=Alkalibacterium kapii TaxID=426704 RepID=A0A511ARH3_9LACT|nr:mechanosensitive ion channel domain-containing protein [Alkalibacterium kapii]GEK90804.1 mechanosensitive ion channel protein MscS [Alkalibacterium kapii]
MEQLTILFEKFQNSEIGFWLGAIIGIAIVLLARAGVHSVLNRVVKQKRTQLFLETIVNWITLFILVIYFFMYFSKTSIIYQTLFVFGNTEITVFLILTVLFAIVLAVKFSKAIREYILPTIYDKYGLDRGLQASMNTFFHYSIITLAIVISLSSIGFNLTSLTVLASVLGVGIGFGLQNVMSNFISGLIILFERPIRVGDRVIIDDTIADVEEIKIRATVVRTRVNERMIIPNSYFLEEKFVNRSYTDRRLRIPVKIGVAYGSDIERVKQLLYEAVDELREETWPNVLEKPAPRVFFEEFGDSSLDFTVWFWIDSQIDEREFTIPSDLRFKIVNKFAENEISIPFPQRDIHVVSTNK